MKILRIDHIGIAVQNLTEVKSIFENLFSFHEHFSELVINQKVSTVGYQLADSNLEFLEATSTESPISKFIEKRGNAVHHIALTVENLDAALLELKNKKVQLIDEAPRIGAEGKRIAFIHPKSTAGILIELSEIKK